MHRGDKERVELIRTLQLVEPEGSEHSPNMRKRSDESSADDVTERNSKESNSSKDNNTFLMTTVTDSLVYYS